MQNTAPAPSTSRVTRPGVFHDWPREGDRPDLPRP
jgi:hypothetical protein